MAWYLCSFPGMAGRGVLVGFSSITVTKELMKLCVLGTQSWPGNFYELCGAETPFPWVVSSAAFELSHCGSGQNPQGSPVRENPRAGRKCC